MGGIPFKGVELFFAHWARIRRDNTTTNVFSSWVFAFYLGSESILDVELFQPKRYKYKQSDTFDDQETERQ